MRFTRLLSPKVILDAGCGRGDYSFYMAEYWPEALIDAVDIDGQCISKNKLVQRRLGLENIRFEVQDITKVGSKEKYDLIVCVDVLEHIRE